MSSATRSALTFIVAALLTTASAASASEFEAGEYSATIDAVQNGFHVFTTEAGEGECEEVTATEGLGEPSETLTVAPEFINCTVFGLEASVSAEECSLRLNAGAAKGGGAFEGTTDILCPPGDAIVISVLPELELCEILIGPQSELSGVEYVNNPSAEPEPAVTVKLNLSNLEYEVQGPEFCGSSGTNGTYVGDVMLDGEREEKPTAVQVGDGKTRLCEEKPPCTKKYPGKTPIEATLKVPTSIDLEGSSVIGCAQSKITTTTEKEEDRPLLLESFTVTFVGCELNKAACKKVEMTEKPTAKLYGFAGRDFGNIIVPITLFLECNFVKCEYKSTVSPIAMFFQGGTPKAKIEFINQIIPKKTMMGEAGCSANALWEAEYIVNEPKPVWPSK